MKKSETRAGGQKQFRVFPEIHPFLRAEASLSLRGGARLGWRGHQCPRVIDRPDLGSSAPGDLSYLAPTQVTKKRGLKSLYCLR